MRNREIVLDYLGAFSAGDTATVAATLADSFCLSGPFLTCDSKQDYLEALRRDPLPPARLEMIELLERGETVAAFYRYIKPGGGNTVAQLFWLDGGKITKTLLVFDSAGVGAGNGNGDGESAA